MIESIDNLLSDFQRFNSLFQIKEFILEAESGGTAYGYYKQCLRELHARRCAFNKSVASVLRLEAKMQELERATPTSEILISRFENRNALSETYAVMSEQWREMHIYWQHAKAVRKLLPDPLTDQERDRLELEFWTSTVARRIHIERLAQGSISQETLKMLYHLPTENQAVALDTERGIPRFTPPSIDVQIPPLPETSVEALSCLDRLLLPTP